MWRRPRDRAGSDGADKVPRYIDPSVELNLGLWMLFAGATVLLFTRVWIKVTRRHGLWYDDYILIASWVSTRISNTGTLVKHDVHSSSFLSTMP
jgi:hypothetical protein